MDLSILGVFCMLIFLGKQSIHTKHLKKMITQNIDISSRQENIDYEAVYGDGATYEGFL